MKMTTTLYKNNTHYTDQLLSNEEIMQNALFVLDQGWHTLIKKCAEAGASIVLPNFHMSSALLVQTIIREGKSAIATSKELWDQVKDTFAEYPHLKQNMKVFLFEEKENIAKTNIKLHQR